MLWLITVLVCYFLMQGKDTNAKRNHTKKNKALPERIVCRYAFSIYKIAILHVASFKSYINIFLVPEYKKKLFLPPQLSLSLRLIEYNLL